MTKDPTPKLDAQRALPRKKLFETAPINKLNPVSQLMVPATPESLEMSKLADDMEAKAKITMARMKAMKSKRGRPAGKGEKPWIAEGISRQAWYKRKAKGDGK